MVVSAASGLAALEDVRKFHPMADTDHFTIAKPNSRQDSVYLTFTREVKKLIYQVCMVPRRPTVSSFERAVYACNAHDKQTMYCPNK